MTIKVGDRIPDVTLTAMGAYGPAPVTTEELFSGKKVALFAVPGAFTPTCSAKHLPGFVDQAGAIKAKGVDTVACVSVNDIFVMDAWGKSQNVGDKVMMLADGSGSFAGALDLELDLVERGLGVRSRRYSMIVDDGTVTRLNLEEGGGFEVSDAGTLLDQIVAKGRILPGYQIITKQFIGGTTHGQVKACGKRKRRSRELAEDFRKALDEGLVQIDSSFTAADRTKLIAFFDEYGVSTDNIPAAK